MRSSNLMFECPSPAERYSGIGWSVTIFLLVPFLLPLFYYFSPDDTTVAAWMDIVYHAINFLASLFIFRKYLVDAWLIVQVETRKILTTAGICAAAMLVFPVTYLILYAATSSPALALASQACLPLAEIELYMTAPALFSYNMVGGAVVLVLLVPVTICCLFYGTVFAPASCSRPWLGYVLLPLVVGFPRICNLLYFSPTEELILFLAQLPLHFIACWGYHKTDTIWTPIFAFIAANLVSCIFLLPL